MKWPPNCQMKSSSLSVQLLYLTRIFLSNLLPYFLAVFMKAVTLIYTQPRKHLNAHGTQPFLQPGIDKAHPSAYRTAGKYFFSPPLNGQLLINTKNINWFLINKCRAIVLSLREVCGRWTKNPMRLSCLLLGGEANVKIRKHFVLPSRMKVGRIYWHWRHHQCSYLRWSMVGLLLPCI